MWEATQAVLEDLGRIDPEVAIEKIVVTPPDPEAYSRIVES